MIGSDNSCSLIKYGVSTVNSFLRGCIVSLSVSFVSLYIVFFMTIPPELCLRIIRIPSPTSSISDKEDCCSVEAGIIGGAFMLAFIGCSSSTIGSSC